MIKTFRGLLADGAQDRIRLQTIKGKVGYRIARFDVIPEKPVTAANECVLQIWKDSQGTPSGEVNFTDSALLGIGIYSNQTDTTYYPDDTTIIFDNEIVNQDIFITHKNETGSGKCNYYLELEVIPLDDAGAEYTTLKDLRQVG